VLGGGEDHGLLAAFPPGDLPPGFRAIGRLADGAGVTVDGLDPATVTAGWDPFGGWDGGAG